VPVILLHGLGGSPLGLEVLCRRLEAGRTVVHEFYVDDADALQPGDLPPDAVVDFGYYQHSAAGPKYDPDAQGKSHGSIGGCPVARTDGLDVSYYTTSYADRLKHCVDGVLRATGKSQVDLVGHSMGGVVVRAYTKWLSVDANGNTPVRRILLLGSPSRGLNAVEALVLASQQSGPTEFMRLGECVELCREGPFYGGRSFLDILNDGWDAFCQSHGIVYGGLVGTGAWGLQPPQFSSAQVQGFVSQLNPTVLALLAGVTAVFWNNISPELNEALGPGDDEVPVPVARLDQAPFLGGGLSCFVEARHVFEGDSDRSVNESALSAEAVRAFCFASGRLPQGATCPSVTLTPESATGHATWLAAQVEIGSSGALSAQLVEETLDASGSAVAAIGSGQALRPGSQTLGFFVAPGGGTRQYHLVVYGEKGPIATYDSGPLTLVDGAVDVAPQASIGAVTSTASSLGPIVHAVFSSNAAPGDPQAGFRVRLDHGDWSSLSTSGSFDTPPLGLGLHRLEVLARSSTNAANVAVDESDPAAVDLLVDAQANVTVTR
jgi:pimeloyl-ACP methyl ester carboxylesterase